MFKKSITALLLAGLTASAVAADYYIVVPFRDKVSSPSQPATPPSGGSGSGASIAVTLNSLTLPEGLAGSAYPTYDLSSAVQVTGDSTFNGTGVTWSLAGGSLPAGLQLNANGTVTGTPTEAGTSSFTARATYKTASGTQTYQLVVINITVSLAPATLPVVPVFQSYSYDFRPQLSVSGDSSYDLSKVTWSLASGTLPTGLSFSNGRITGTSQLFDKSGANISVRATYRGKEASQSYTLYPGDPYINSVGALLHFNGANGSTTFTDVKGLNYTVSNGAAISNASAVFGQAGYFAGNSRIISTNSASNFYFPGDFTLEGWVRFNNISTTWNSYSPSNQYILDIGANKTYFSWRSPTGWTFYGGPTVGNIVTYMAIPELNRWYHFAVQRSGTTVSMFIDGTEVATKTGVTAALGAANSSLAVGNFGGSPVTYGLNGMLDDVRITPNAARYSGNFTRPAFEFPDQ